MKKFESRSFQSPKTGRDYLIHQGSCLPPHLNHVEKLTTICNQADIYQLFKKLEGRPYSNEDALSFLKWIDEGWANQTHFVFLVTSSGGEIVAALDIKSENLEAAEIGYWCDQDHRGITSTAVLIMVEWAKEQGYQSLFAKPINVRSACLLDRAGFTRRDCRESEFGQWTTKF